MNSNIYRTLSLVACLLAGCGASPVDLDPNSAQHLKTAIPDGTRVYSGLVVPMGATVPAFQYVRHVDRTAAEWKSTHVTRRISGPAIVWQEAIHDARYRLQVFTEIHGQTGTVGRLKALSDGRFELARTRAGRTEKAHLERGLPVVVGPTLFGFITQHQPRLAAGERISFRFALPDQLTSYDFEVRLVRRSSTDLTFEVAPRSWWVGLGIDPMTVVFDQAGRAVSYRGRIPCRGDALEALDAQVTYRSNARFY